MRYSIYKVPDGKMIKVKLSLDSDRIAEIVFTGDFFLHPEDALDQIERYLIGKPLNKEELVKSIDSTLEMTQAKLIGATAEDFAEAIMQSS